jgi:hypothetical protein
MLLWMTRMGVVWMTKMGVFRIMKKKKTLWNSVYSVVKILTRPPTKA